MFFANSWSFAFLEFKIIYIKNITTPVSASLEAEYLKIIPLYFYIKNWLGQPCHNVWTLNCPGKSAFSIISVPWWAKVTDIKNKIFCSMNFISVLKDSLPIMKLYKTDLFSPLMTEFELCDHFWSGKHTMTSSVKIFKNLNFSMYLLSW